LDESNEKRRRFPRIASENVVLVRDGAAADAERLGKTRALGLGGCSFVTDHPPRIGAFIELLLSLGGRVVTTRSRVIYEIASGDRREIGVEFLEIDRADREHLERYFRSNEPTG
jgi:c-di-GMP-binding flagellar brake protein YcgR